MIVLSPRLSTPLSVDSHCPGIILKLYIQSVIFTYIDVKLDTSLQVFIDHDMNSGLSYVQSVSTSFCINLRPLKDFSGIKIPFSNSSVQSMLKFKYFSVEKPLKATINPCPDFSVTIKSHDKMIFIN